MTYPPDHEWRIWSSVEFTYLHVTASGTGVLQHVGTSAGDFCHPRILVSFAQVPVAPRLHQKMIGVSESFHIYSNTPQYSDDKSRLYIELIATGASGHLVIEVCDHSGPRSKFKLSTGSGWNADRGRIALVYMPVRLVALGGYHRCKRYTSTVMRLARAMVPLSTAHFSLSFFPSLSPLVAHFTPYPRQGLASESKGKRQNLLGYYLICDSPIISYGWHLSSITVTKGGTQYSGLKWWNECLRYRWPTDLLDQTRLQHARARTVVGAVEPLTPFSRVPNSLLHAISCWFDFRNIPSFHCPLSPPTTSRLETTTRPVKNRDALNGKTTVELDAYGHSKVGCDNVSIHMIGPKSGRKFHEQIFING
ncbi:hypothetical protein BGW80DRAFT_1445934 [Lactifluus volemus]|nr:hypothetical protein BGW80DRAFT_1445934 [Lactifluus volemus]